MIIDSHLHFNLSGKDKEQAVEGLLRDLAIVGVDKTCLMPHTNTTGIGHLYSSRDEIIQSTEDACRSLEKHLEDLYILVWLNPLLPFDFLKGFVKDYIINGPVTGVKLSIQMNATDTRLDPLLTLLEENDIPLLFHCWYKTVQKYRYESDPRDMACIAKKHPSLRVLVAHLTGCGFRGVQDIRKYPNLFLDTCGSQPEDGLLQYALDNLGSDRILFGSDYPGRDIASQLGRIDSVDMSLEDREKILYKNAIQFFEGGRDNA
ncbi:MAG: amidohydrolase family protein [Clostridiales bacterium]|nr:amidohydrolase family protein [Clostridiales bacterium]